MKKILVTIFILSALFTNGQIEPGVKYYSDKYGYKEVTKGNYKKELTRVNDSVLSEVFSKTKNNQIIWTKSYLREQPYGIWKWYDKKGNVQSERNYDFVLKYGEYIPEGAVTLESLGIEQRLDKNTGKIQRHIRDRFMYPEIAQANGIQGKVKIQLVIDENGKVNNLRILEKSYLSLDTECFRIMNTLKELEPYEKEGQRIKVYYTLPITFRLQ